jgi:hypothetical protein
MMKKILTSLILVSSYFTAYSFRIEYGNNVVISLPVYEDLYIAGGTVIINAPVHGDLVIAGGNVSINDSVMNDILVAGGTVTFRGYVGEAIRCIGGKINIGKHVAGDVVIAGGNLIINKNASIGGLLASAGDVTIEGDVNGSIKGAFGDFILNGNISKNIDCPGSTIKINGIIHGHSILAARNIAIGSHAAFHNNIRFWNDKGSLDVRQSLKNGSLTYDPSLRIQTGEWYYLGAVTIMGLLWYIGTALLMIMIVQFLFPSVMKKAADSVFNKTAKSLGMGILFFLGIPIALLICMLSIIAIPVAIIALLSFLILILLAIVISSVIVANWINNRFAKKWNYWRLCFTGLGVFILFKLLSIIPVAGWLIMTLIVCIVFGSIIINTSFRKKSNPLVLE